MHAKSTMPGMLIITFFCIVTAVLLVPVVAHAASTQPDILPPLKQLQQGVTVADIQCGDEKILLNSPSGRVACVYPDTAERLVLRGWEVLPQSKQSLEEDVSESGIDIIDLELSRCRRNGSRDRNSTGSAGTRTSFCKREHGTGIRADLLCSRQQDNPVRCGKKVATFVGDPASGHKERCGKYHNAPHRKWSWGHIDPPGS